MIVALHDDNRDEVIQHPASGCTTVGDWLWPVLSSTVEDLASTVGFVDEFAAEFTCWSCDRGWVRFALTDGRGSCSHCRRGVDVWDLALRVMRDRRLRDRLREVQSWQRSTGTRSSDAAHGTPATSCRMRFPNRGGPSPASLLRV